MGVFEGITHSEEIKELLDSAQTMYDSAVSRLETHKKNTSESLENLGKVKLEAWSGDMNTFLSRFGMFANVQMTCIDNTNLDFIEHDLTPSQLMVNMRTASVTANEILKAGVLSIGTGALVGIASYGGVMMFAKASTGTAIAALSGAAKTNATLAWFGGGSIKAGGLGVLAGKVVLAGVVLAPIAIVAGSIAAAKGKERLVEAKKVHAEAKNAVAQMETVITELEGIERISESYIELLQGLSRQFRPFLNEMESIAKDYTPGSDGKIDFNQLSEMEQKTLHLSWLLAQLYYHSLSKPILTDDGKVDPQANSMLTYSQREYRQLSLNVSNLATEKQKIKQLLEDAKKNFASASKNIETQRVKFKKYYAKQGEKIVQRWDRIIGQFVESLSKFENINVSNVFVSDKFNSEIEDAFEKIFSVSNTAKFLIEKGLVASEETSMIDVAISGIHALEISETENISQILSDVKKEDTTIWLQKGILSKKELMVADSLDTNAMYNVENLLNSITGKENLNTSEYINEEVSEVVKSMNMVIDKMKDSNSILKKQTTCLKRITRLLMLYKSEMEKIYQSYSAENEIVDFEKLQEEECRVIQMACNLAKLYYCVSNSKIFDAENDLFGRVSISTIIREAKKELRTLRKTTYKMTEANLLTANIMWAPEACNIFIVNCIFMLIFVVVSVIQLINKDLFGLAGIAGTIIVLPKFFFIKNLRESQLWFWRLARLIISCIVVLTVEIIGMVV